MEVNTIYRKFISNKMMIIFINFYLVWTVFIFMQYAVPVYPIVLIQERHSLINTWMKRGFCDLNDFCGYSGRPQVFHRMPCSWHRKNKNYPVASCPAASGHRQIAGRVARLPPPRTHSLPWTGSKRFSSCLTSFELMEGFYIFHRYFLRSGEKSATQGFLWTGATFLREKIFPCRYRLSCKMSYPFIAHA